MNALLAALVNGAIPSAVVTALVWLALRAAPRRTLNAATRYAIWWAALALAVTLPCVYLRLPARAVQRPVVRQSARGFTSGGQTAAAAAGAVRRSAPNSVRAAGTAGGTRPVPREDVRRAAQPAPVAAVSAWPVFPLQVTAEGWPEWVLAAWALASSLMLLRLGLSCLLLRRTSSRAADAPAALQGQARRWLALCGSRRPGIRLASSEEIDIPVAVGPLCPSILIPARLLEELEGSDLDQIGVHETAHLARGDDYALLAQRFVEALFALHPVVRWIARQIDLEREIACDDFVVAAMGQPRSYATCLTRVVELAGGVGFSLAGASAADDRSHLSRRVEMLLDKTRHTGTRLLRTRLGVTVAALAALAWAAGKTPGLVAFAQPLARIAWSAPRTLIHGGLLPQAVQAAPATLQNFDSRVLEDASGNPLASAEFRFRQAGARELAADLDTDRQGRVHIPGLPAGEYDVEVMKPNYVTASLRVRVPSPNLLVRLVRYGVITGKVTDAEGRPAPGVIHIPTGRAIGGTRITIMVKTPGSGELKSVRETQVDDDGRYRVYDLPPGQYAVGVWYDGLKDGSGVQLYPSNTDPRFFTMEGGEEYPGVDFTILARAAYQVSGKVEGATAKKQFSLALGLPDQPALPVAQTMTEDDGSFRFEKVPAGSYNLFVAGPSNGYGARAITLGPEPLYARSQVQVAGQNVEGLNIAVTTGRSVTVALRAQGGEKAPPGCPASVNLSLTELEPWGLMRNDAADTGFGKEQTIRNVPPGRVRIMANGLGTGCYQAASPVVDLSAEAAAPVAVELAAAGAIHGTVRPGTQPAKDLAVVLLDNEAAADTPAQLAFPDVAGRFVFTGLRPGRYRIGARPAAEGTRTRWVGNLAGMVEIDVAGGAPTTVELPVTGSKGEGQ